MGTPCPSACRLASIIPSPSVRCGCIVRPNPSRNASLSTPRAPSLLIWTPSGPTIRTPTPSYVRALGGRGMCLAYRPDRHPQTGGRDKPLLPLDPQPLATEARPIGADAGRDEYEIGDDRVRFAADIQPYGHGSVLLLFVAQRLG